MGEITPYSAAALAALASPAPLNANHDAANFDCGKAALNDWLRESVRRPDGQRTRCYVVAQRSRVAGFYCLSAGAVELEGISAKATKKASDPAPVVVIGRLAVDKPLQGKGLGRAILKDALSRIVKASEMVDAKAVIVHAVDQEAVPFYARYGFHPFPLGNQTLYLTINEVIASL